MAQHLFAAFVYLSSEIRNRFLYLSICHLGVAFNEMKKQSGKEVKCGVSANY